MCMKESLSRYLTSSTGLFIWTGGALFVASLGVCAYRYLFVWGRPSVPAAGLGPLGALAVDVALLTLFAAHHSIFARGPVKARLARVIPTDLIRSVYVWIASLLLMSVCLLWR